jgi:SPP1 gp7 family putative phage head morphogenesis protein
MKKKNLYSKLENHFSKKRSKQKSFNCPMIGTPEWDRLHGKIFQVDEFSEVINKGIESEEDQAFLNAMIQGLELDDGMNDTFDYWYLKAANLAGDEALKKLGIHLVFNLKDGKLLNQLKKRGVKITGQISKKTLSDFQQILYESYLEEGISPYDVEKRIDGLFEETYKNRAMTIARTETGIASSMTEFEAYRKNGVQKKKWLAIIDDRTRDSHIEANGQIQPIDEPFILVTHSRKHGDIESELMFPLDPEGEAQEIINCRCTFTAVFDDSDIADDADAWTGGD